jgi:GntR family transcriptional regulator
MTHTKRMAQPVSRPHAGQKAEAARRVRDRLRDDIRAGRFKDGLLPPEPTLMVEEHASRNAVRLALNLLRAEGLVQRFQGVGTLVVGDIPIFVPLDPGVGFRDLLDGGDARVRIDNHASFATTAPPGLAGHLEIPVGAEVVFLERVMFLDERPLTLRSSWILGSLAQPLLTGKIDLQQSIFAILEHGLGLELGVTEYSIEATLADEAVASVMRVPIGSPMSLSQNLSRLANGRRVEYGFARSPGDRVRFVTSVTHKPDVAQDSLPPCPMVAARRLIPADRPDRNGNYGRNV